MLSFFRSDGIRPGCDLTDLDNSWDSRPSNRNGKFSQINQFELKNTHKNKLIYGLEFENFFEN